MEFLINVRIGGKLVDTYTTAAADAVSAMLPAYDKHGPCGVTAVAVGK